MAVKIRLKRMGKIRQPYFRLVVVDSRKKRDGRVIEEIGKYHPKAEPSLIDVVSDRAQYWLGVGAQPTEAVEALLKITGDWQRFKGLPGAEGTLRTAEPKRDKAEIFNEALKESAREPSSEAVTKKAAKRAPAKAAPETAPEATPEAASEAAEPVAEASNAVEAESTEPTEPAEPAEEPAAEPVAEATAEATEPAAESATEAG